MPNSYHQPTSRMSKTDQAERIIEIRSEPQQQQQQQHFGNTSGKKRTRSPSNPANTSAKQPYASSAAIPNLQIYRDYKGLLNLAHKCSFRSRSSQQSRFEATPDASMPRSLSVNYLYQKRQGRIFGDNIRINEFFLLFESFVNFLLNEWWFAGDLRRYQNTSMIDVSQKNHSGFTTEDIDDIYMPRQLDLFERKLKASHDLSDTSEQEEIRLRQRRQRQFAAAPRQSRSSKYNSGGASSKMPPMPSSSKRPRQEDRSKIVINYGKFSEFTEPARTTFMTTAPAAVSGLQHGSVPTSYLEEAKRKLEEMKSSKAYYYNLNNKMKASVNNLVKASYDLARNSEFRQR